FQNISNEFKRFSAKGQVPFIELNGLEIADSNIIIEELKEKFGKVEMEPADPVDQATARAYGSLVEDHLSWTLVGLRSKFGSDFILSDDGFGRHYGSPAMKYMIQFFGRFMINRQLYNKAQAQGMGKHSPEELHAMAKRDLQAISLFLGKKPYFGGD
ncbi:hypothetical protein PMAYCL1PPCAC_25169, partial [Pristionchus mayeri]